MEISKAALACVIVTSACGVILAVAIWFLNSCQARELAWRDCRLRELTEENNRLKAERKYEVIVTEAKAAPARATHPALPYRREDDRVS